MSQRTFAAQLKIYRSWQRALLARIYRGSGTFPMLYQRALHISEQACGPEHSRTARIIHGIAIFQEAQRNRSEAKSLYARALAVRERVLGAHYPKTMETRTRLIASLYTLEQHEEAAKFEAAQPEQ